MVVGRLRRAADALVRKIRMRDVLKYFPLKRYGAIALIFVFLVFSSFYYLFYFPSLNILQSFGTHWPGVPIRFIVPKYITNGSELKIVVNASTDEVEIEIRTMLGACSSGQNFSGNTVNTIAVHLNSGEVGERGFPITVYGLQDRSRMCIAISCHNSNTLRRYYFSVVYSPFYAWIISVLTSIPTTLSLIFVGSVVICSIAEDDRQDFHPMSQIGRYYIARIFFRASTVLSLIFIALYVFSVQLGIVSYRAFTGMALSFVLLFFSWVFIKVTTRLIDEKPKATIIIDGRGTQKELEVFNSSKNFNMKGFWSKVENEKRKDKSKSIDT